jgi:hypothetical protein
MYLKLSTALLWDRNVYIIGENALVAQNGMDDG